MVHCVFMTCCTNPLIIHIIIINKTCISRYDNGAHKRMQLLRVVSCCVGAHSTVVRDTNCNVMMMMLQTRKRRRLMD